MKKLLLILLTSHFSLLTPFCFSQNLVPNPSFEQYDTCPSAASQISYATGWMSFAITPDYFHTCATNSSFSVPYNWFGYQQPASGNAYTGLATKDLPTMNFREYTAIQLTDTLIIGKAYTVSFKANLGLNLLGPLKPNCATNNLGVLFTTYPFYWDGTTANYPLYVKNFAHILSNQIITDTIGWTTISDTVIADSNYTYMVIGNFFIDSLTSHIKYFDNGYSECVAYYFIDDVYVGEITTSVNETETANTITIYYSEGIIIVNIYPYFISTKTTELRIYNLVGQKVFIKKFEDRNITININNLTKGMYMIQIQNGNKIYIQKIIK